MSDDDVVGLVSAFSDAEEVDTRVPSAIDNVRKVEQRLLELQGELAQLRQAMANGCEISEALRLKERDLSRLIRQAERSRQIFEMRAQQLQKLQTEK